MKQAGTCKMAGNGYCKTWCRGYGDGVCTEKQSVARPIKGQVAMEAETEVCDDRED